MIQNNKKHYNVSKRVLNKANIGHYVFLSVHTLVVLLPFCWLLLTSLKSSTQIANNPVGFPRSISFQNYVDAWEAVNMLTLFKNSIFVCSISVLCVVFIAALSGFVLSRFMFKVNPYIYIFFLIGMMIPVNAAVIPLFINLRDLGILNTYLAVILPYISFHLPLSIFLTTGYMKSIPNEMEQSALIDGCGVLQIFYHIILPLSAPILATTAIIVFMFLWNEFLFALVFITGAEYQTVPLGIMSFKGEYSTNFATQTAGIVIAIIPTVIIYIILRERIIDGITAGSVKG